MRIVGAIYPSESIYLIISPLIENQKPELLKNRKNMAGIVMSILNIQT
jgi:hypothetical protein